MTNIKCLLIKNKDSFSYILDKELNNMNKNEIETVLDIILQNNVELEWGHTVFIGEKIMMTDDYYTFNYEKDLTEELAEHMIIEEIYHFEEFAINSCDYDRIMNEIQEDTRHHVSHLESLKPPH